MVVFGIPRKCARVEDEDPEESAEPIEGPHSYACPDPGIVHSSLRKFQVAFFYIIVRNPGLDIRDALKTSNILV